MEIGEKIDNGEVINEGGERVVVRDCGDYFEVIPTGVVFKNDKLLVVSEDEIIRNEEDDDDNDVIRFSVPAIVFKCPKQMPQNMSLESLTDQVLNEAMGKYMVSYKEGLEKAWMAREEKKKKKQNADAADVKQ